MSLCASLVTAMFFKLLMATIFEFNIWRAYLQARSDEAIRKTLRGIHCIGLDIGAKCAPTHTYPQMRTGNGGSVSDHRQMQPARQIFAYIEISLQMVHREGFVGEATQGRWNSSLLIWRWCSRKLVSLKRKQAIAVRTVDMF
uniref:Secreted protein n=1 Tax=Ditylenchus dipsaci TaxID=166011 RepID=A0A915DMF8_9BILA